MQRNAFDKYTKTLSNSKLAAAKYMLSHGAAIFSVHGIVVLRCTCGRKECPHRAKHPATIHGVKDATKDIAALRAALDDQPFLNYGVATGAASGFFVVDLDGAVGRSNWTEIQRLHEDVPDTLTVKTGNGLHLYFRTEGETIRSSAGKLAKKIDIRGDGGYVVGPSSRHANGNTYTIVDKACQIAPAPRWLLDLLVRPQLGAPSDNTPYGVATLKSEVERLIGTPAGQRNDALNKAAFRLAQLLAEGHLTVSAIEADLVRAARQIGLDESEILPTVRSGIRAGALAPRMPQSRHVSVDTQTEQLAKLGETDADFAERFAKRHQARLAYTPGRAFLVFDGRRWQADHGLERHRLAEETARQIAGEAAFLSSDAAKATRAKFSTACLGKGAIERMLDLARHRLMMEDSSFDRDPLLINLQNGTLDLKTGLVRPARPDDRITKLANVAYKDGAVAPRFQAFLARSLSGDAELLQFLQRAVGLTLTGDVSEHVFFFVHGPGRTGKSVFVNLLRDILGDYGTHTPTDTLLAKHFDNGISNDLARMVGARMVTAIEANWNKSIDESRIKSMTGGEPITARFMRQDFFEFQPAFKLWFVANDFPEVRGTADAFFSRVRVLPFLNIVPDADQEKNLGDVLRAEAPGVLNWAIAGCLAWQKFGLKPPSRVVAATAEWKRNADHVQKFADEELISDPQNYSMAGNVFDRYGAWCRRHGEQPLSDRKFKKALEHLGFVHARNREGSIWRAVRLRT